MPLELTARTPAGARLVRPAGAPSVDLGRCAAVRDDGARFPVRAVAALKRAGYFGAPVPEPFGGLGVGSIHDVVVASSRLARGDASVAIGVNMHLAALLSMVRRRQIAV